MESDSEDNSKSCDSWDDDPEIKEIKEMEVGAIIHHFVTPKNFQLPTQF